MHQLCQLCFFITSFENMSTLPNYAFQSQPVFHTLCKILVIFQNCNAVRRKFKKKPAKGLWPYCAKCFISIIDGVAQQGISWKQGKTSKFQTIHSTVQIWTDFHENEAKKKKKMKKNQFKMSDFSKWSFFKIANSQNFFAKISEIGPWLSRIE